MSAIEVNYDCDCCNGSRDWEGGGARIRSDLSGDLSKGHGDDRSLMR